MLNINQFRDLIVRPALHDLMLYSIDAEELLVFTCANESLGGTFIHQVDGPALGIFQMEPATYNDLWQNYIKSNGRLMMILFSNFMVNSVPAEERMIYDIRFATAMARLFYARIAEPLPSAMDENAIYSYYKRYYNTSLGAANQEQAISKYHLFRSSR